MHEPLKWKDKYSQSLLELMSDNTAGLCKGLQRYEQTQLSEHL